MWYLRCTATLIWSHSDAHVLLCDTPPDTQLHVLLGQQPMPTVHKQGCLCSPGTSDGVVHILIFLLVCNSQEMTRVITKIQYLCTVIIHASKDVVHEVKLLARSVRQNEASTHDGDLRMLNLQQTGDWCIRLAFHPNGY